MLVLDEIKELILICRSVALFSGDSFDLEKETCLEGFGMTQNREWDKQSYEEDSRALIPKDFECFEGKNSRKPLNYYVDFVKKHPELEFCFRGNSKDKPKISIYMNNHVILNVFTTGKIQISFNHARYCENWNKYYKKLISDYGFTEKDTNPVNGKISIGTMSRPMRKNGALSFDKIEELYEEILKPIFESYYEAIEKGNATDYFKGKSGVSISGKEEKKVQQKLYSTFQYKKDGYFFYDMEFAQRHKDRESQRNDKNNNKPDMLAIKFDKNGNPDRIVLVEVKCKKGAMGGTSGIKEHLDKMKKYDKLTERRREACQIMNQYAQLGLRGLSENDCFDYKYFEKLKLEILLIFTGEAARLWKRKDYDLIRKQTDEISSPAGIEASIYKLK